MKNHNLDPNNNNLYTQSGRLMEFDSLNKECIKFIALRFIAFLIDFAIIFALLIVMWFVMAKSLMYATMICIAWAVPYYAITMFSFDASPGMLITKLRIGHCSGFMVPKWQVFVRALVNSTYAIPFLGWVVMFCNCFLVLIYRGWTLGDIVSRTTVFTLNTYVNLNDIVEEVSTHQ